MKQEMDQLHSSEDFHKKMAVDLFNYVWTFLDLEDRTSVQEQTMIHAAHASRYHWEQVGSPINKVRGDWQLARVYSVSGRSEPAIYHARVCLDLCLDEEIGDFDLAFAYEAMARAYKLAGQTEKKEEYKELALKACEEIKNEPDRRIVMEDLASL
ncbi:hypothetical protein N780_05520 [Pontibacillus chungwhensis BH030062]|uniref:Tetratricopeptide repeat protein n=1 Tax=Pontibacillus chungwhensis BH030062 TaxID=1385513 RepID=A0A0A2UV74_9BACI|nr:hypothetical protein [Pontibacillus chungwhensis]KGP90366.1 hypothetical protein N780_05520 [Pontibacillus chungwhensis BH030062]